MALTEDTVVSAVIKAANVSTNFSLGKKIIMVACREDLTEIYKVMGGGEKMDCSLSPSV